MVRRARAAQAAHVVAGGPAGRLALFDLDRTLLPGSSLVRVGRALADAGLVPRRILATAVLRNLRFRWRGAGDAEVARARDVMLALVAGQDQATLHAALHGVAERLAADVSPGARRLVTAHLEVGDRCVLLSASPDEVVDAVARQLGAELGIGTRAEVVDGRYTGRLDGPFCYGAGKLARLRDVLGVVDLADAAAYADSASDLPVLRACGRPVAVNPDRRLRAAAQAGGWPVLRLG